MDAAPVTVEAHLANGLPSFTIVGASRTSNGVMIVRHDCCCRLKIDQ
jgi:hypothetical protein